MLPLRAGLADGGYGHVSLSRNAAVGAATALGGARFLIAVAAGRDVQQAGAWSALVGALAAWPAKSVVISHL